jgi:hypothetical protein
MFFVRVNRFWCVWMRVPVWGWLREQLAKGWSGFLRLGV